MESKKLAPQFPKIKTGNGFQNDLIATSNNRIELAVLDIRKLQKGIIKFEKTIVSLDDKNGKLQKNIFWLTIVGLILAATQIIQVIDVIIEWYKA